MKPPTFAAILLIAFALIPIAAAGFFGEHWELLEPPGR